MEIWFNRKNKRLKYYRSKLITLKFYPHCWKLLMCESNGAKKGFDKCYDFNIHFLGFLLSYTNFDYSTNEEFINHRKALAKNG